jgi:ABC-2 type transport system permease protein
MSEVPNAGAIYDLGYQRYSGVRLGRSYVFRTLLAFSFKSAFGVGRGEKAKSLPVIVAAIVYLPALVQIGVASAVNVPGAINYANHLEFTSFLLALFAAAQAPELIVTDRQQGMLALYLSRPLRGLDYAIAKLAALSGALLVLTLGPQLILFLGRVMLSDKPWPTFVSEYAKLVPMVGGTLLVSLFFAAIGLGLSSFASRRGYATATVIAFFLLTAGMSEMVRTVAFGSVQRYAVLGNPAALVSGFARWLFEIEARRHSEVGRAALPGTLYLYVMLAATAIAVAMLLNRYRRGDA